MTITRQVAERSTCPRAKVGAVIVRDKNILATGYNGTIHAEINAIAQAAKNGATITGADIYVTHTPCIHCLKVLINTGICRVYYEREYKKHTLAELLAHAHVQLEHVPVANHV
jgi:dCMP deaminase